MNCPVCNHATNLESYFCDNCGYEIMIISKDASEELKNYIIGRQNKHYKNYQEQHSFKKQNIVLENNLTTNTKEFEEFNIIHNRQNEEIKQYKIKIAEVNDELNKLKLANIGKTSNYEVHSTPYEIWIDEPSGLLLKNNKLYYVPANTNNEIPTIITDRAIWTAGNVSYDTYARTGYNINKNWEIPRWSDWVTLSRYIAAENDLVSESINDVSFIHPTYNVANKFGIDYACSTFAILNKIGYDMSALVVSKHEGVYQINDLAPNDYIGIRCFLPITFTILKKLSEANYKFPKHINANEIIPFSDFTESHETQIIYNSGMRVVCSNKFSRNNPIDELLLLGNIYTVDEVSESKKRFTLTEFPQNNRSEKKKWFDFENFKPIL